MNVTDLPERIASKIEADPATGCWLWRGYLNNRGYAQIQVHRVSVFVHRLTYQSARGAIPEGLELDHLCRVPHCCNPAHLEPVTHRENVLRGVSPMAINAARTHCVHGHEFTPENTKRTYNGRRACRACAREFMRGYHLRVKAGGAA